MTEKSVQNEIVNNVRKTNILCIRVNSARIGRLHAYIVYTGIAKPFSKGLNDLILVFRNRVLFVEVKAETGEREPSQFFAHTVLDAHSIPYVTVYSWEQLSTHTLFHELLQQK